MAREFGNAYHLLDYGNQVNINMALEDLISCWFDAASRILQSDPFHD